MSSAATILAEIASLRRDLQQLTSRVERLAAQVESSDFELVEASSAAGVAAVPTPGGSQGSLARGSVPQAASAADAADPDRTKIAIETGLFLKRCLAGEPRGISGQGRIKLQKRIYIVVRNFSGEVFTSPVKIFNSWAETKAQVADPASGEFGDSIWVGLASQWEAKVAVRQAGFDWPVDRHN